MKTISEVINEVILAEIEEVQNTRFPSIYSNQDAVALLYMLNERLRDAIHTHQLEEVKPSTGDDVVKVLEDLKELIRNHGCDIDLNDYVDLDFSNSYGGSYNIEVEVDNYNVTKEYVALITDFISEYENSDRIEESKPEESTN